MGSAPAVLILDDGELEEVAAVLDHVGTSYVRRCGAEIEGPIDPPGQVLITTRKRALEVHGLVPALGSERGPAWVCVHSRDFPGLRSFLTELGVHFLIHTGSGGFDANLLELLFAQLTHPGSERRETLRLPCSCPVTCSFGPTRFEGTLCDLAVDSCRVRGPQEIPITSAISVYLPAELDPAAPTAYSGVVLRTQCVQTEPSRVYATVIGFQDDAVRAQIANILAGQGLGTRVIQLAPPPMVRDEGDTVEIETDRRDDRRRKYERRVACLLSADDESPRVVQAHDISPGGIRVDPHPDLPLEREVILAIHRGRAESPLMLWGCVKRRAANDTLGVEFRPMTPEQRQALDALLDDLPPLESARDTIGEADITIVGELTPAEITAAKRHGPPPDDH